MIRFKCLFIFFLFLVFVGSLGRLYGVAHPEVGIEKSVLYFYVGSGWVGVYLQIERHFRG